MTLGLNPLMEVRTALTTTTSADWSGGTTLGGAEINKVVDKFIIDALNRNTDLNKRVPRKPNNQLAYIWNLRRNLGSASKADWYADGGTGIPYPSQKRQLYAVTKALRSDYEVTGLMGAGASSYFDALADEAKDAVDQLVIVEEKGMICGTDASAYGDTGAYLGLLQLMNSYQLVTDETTSIYGTARASGVTEMDVAAVQAGADAALDVLTIKDLDDAIDKSDKAGGKGDKRIFFCSVERGSEISRLLQPQQRFVAGAGLLNIEGGFSVLTYKGLEIITSRFMDKNGIQVDSASGFTKTYADNAMYLLDMDYIETRILAGVDKKHIPIMGAEAAIRTDVQGGYFKTYSVFVVKEFTRQVLICNLTAP